MKWTQKKIGEWQKQIGQTEKGIINHLVEEYFEFLQAVDTIDEPEEAADLAICLFSYAEVRGFDLLEVVDKKMDKNEDRRWDAPDPKTGIVKHLGK